MPQYEPPFPPTTRRRTATEEDIQARQTQDNPYPQASPHRVGHTPGLHGEDAPYLSQQIIRPGKRRTVEEVERDYPDDPPRRKTTSIYTPAKGDSKRFKDVRGYRLQPERAREESNSSF